MCYCLYYVYVSHCLVVWQHVFALEGREELMKAVHDAAANNVGVSVRQRKEPITFDQCQLHRLGKYRQDGTHRICIYDVFSVLYIL